MKKFIKINLIYPKGIEDSEFISNSELRYLRKRKIIFYDQSTTIREVFIQISKHLVTAYIKRGECSCCNLTDDNTLVILHRFAYNNKWIKIFDLDILISNIVELNGKQFNILLYALVDKGGGICVENGIRYYMNSKEYGKHNLPHVHVEYAGKQASISLDGKIIAGKLPKRQEKEAINKIVNNKESFLFKWNTMTDGSKFEFDKDILVKVDGDCEICQ